VSLGSTLNVTGTTNLSTLALNTNFTIAGNVSINGAFTATNASNDIRGIAVSSLGTDTVNSTSLAASAATEIANQVNTTLGGTHGSGSWEGGGGGSGSIDGYAITVTVTNATDPIEGALVRVTHLIESYCLQTDASGQAQFSLDAYDTWLVSVTKPGFQFTPEIRTVTGNESGTIVDDLEMTQVSPPAAPSDPSQCRVYAYVLAKDGSPVRNAELSATLDTVPARAGGVLVASSIKALSDSDGYVALDLYQTTGLHPTSAKWIIEISAAGYSKTTALDTSTLDLGTLIT
jgi:hypothetical protein